MPHETFSHSATAAASRDDVWNVLQKPETWEGIGGVDRVLDPKTDDKGILIGFSFESVVAGKTYLGEAKPGPREDRRMVTWDIETTDVAGAVVVELTDADGGTLVRVTLNVESRGTLSSIFFPLISSTIGNGFPKTVEDFAAGLG